jgi:hypothetical protein
MNVKSKYEPEEEYVNQHSQYMRGACTALYSLIDGPARVDVSSIHAPRFIKMLFRAMGWKTESDKHPNY